MYTQSNIIHQHNNFKIKEEESRAIARHTQGAFSNICHSNTTVN